MRRVSVDYEDEVRSGGIAHGRSNASPELLRPESTLNSITESKIARVDIEEVDTSHEYFEFPRWTFRTGPDEAVGQRNIVPDLADGPDFLLVESAVDHPPCQAISRERIRQILYRDERERELARQRLQIAAAIRLADDMDVGWPMADIFEVLELPTVARSALELHWTDGAESAAERQICLRELMDLMAPVPDAFGYMTLPALSIRCIGKYGIEALVQGITRIELIGTCRQELENRLELIARWRVRR